MSYQYPQSISDLMALSNSQHPSHPANGPLHQRASRQAYRPYHLSIIMPLSGMLFPLQESGTVAMAVETTLHVHSLGCLRHCLILYADGLFRGQLCGWKLAMSAVLNNRRFDVSFVRLSSIRQRPFVVRSIVRDFLCGMENPDRPEMLLIEPCS
jgi:hypothetical protein